MIGVLARDGRTVEFSFVDGEYVAAFFEDGSTFATMHVESYQGQSIHTVVDLVLATAGEIDWPAHQEVLVQLQRQPELERLAALDDPRAEIVRVLRLSFEG